eukprot:scaffold519619_cov71-Attheya_sp.AAC.1
MDARYNVLVEFAHQHLDFQRAELESVLGMYEISIGTSDDDECCTIPLPGETTELSSSSQGGTRPFLILSFSPNIIGSKISVDNTTTASTTQQPSIKTIADILERCTLVRSVMELWGTGSTIESCVSSIKQRLKRAPTTTPDEQYTTSLVGQRIRQKQQDDCRTWKSSIHTLGSKYTREEQDEMRSNFRFLSFRGKVQMKDPDDEYLLIRELELDSMGGPVYPRFGLNRKMIPENDARPPIGAYFGRVLGGTRSTKGRGGVQQYSLKNRPYLGPTSMDAELSLVMTNLGRVDRHSFCFDPFAGTGSLLLTCALRGAYCFGTDIDLRVLRGRGAKENVAQNFRHYNLARPELVRSDNSIYHRHYRCDAPLYDSIICDPPYGIRAGARQSGSKLASPRPVLEEHRHDHIAQTRPYSVSDVMADLMDVAARTLVLQGRLVYIIPSMTDFDVNEDLPRHECLKLEHVCYQPLSAELGRRIITMVKTSEYDTSRQEDYMLQVWKNGPASAEKCANI